MKILTLLEVGNLGGLVIMIILIIAGVALGTGLFIGVIAKLIYESKDGKKFSKSQFWQTVIITMIICGLISGMICGGS